MSNENKQNAFYCEVKNKEAKKRLAINGGFFHKQGKSTEVARACCIAAMDDKGYNPEDFKKPVSVNFPVVDDLPPEGVFDTDFCNRYKIGGEDGKTMMYIAPSSTSNPQRDTGNNLNVNGEDLAAIEVNMLLPLSGQTLTVRWAAQQGQNKPVTHVSRDELRALHNATEENLPAVISLVITRRASLLEPLEIRELYNLVRDTDRVFPEPLNTDLNLIDAFIGAYQEAAYTDRGLLTKEWLNGNRVSRISSDENLSEISTSDTATVVEEGKKDDEEKPQPSGAVAGEPATAETMEPDTTERHQDARSMDARSQVNTGDVEDLQKMEGTEHPYKENTGGDQHNASGTETNETANSLIKGNGHLKKNSTRRMWYHLMLDLETMGTNSNAPVLVIGCVFFDPLTGETGPVFYVVISLVDAMSTGAVPDGETIVFWLKQSSEARAAILMDPIPLADALAGLRLFIAEHSDEGIVQVWGNGATFDNAMLRTSYERLNIPCPWDFHNDRDVRTIFELGKIIGFDAKAAVPFEGVRHNALDDARHQAKYVSAIWQKLIPNQADF